MDYEPSIGIGHLTRHCSILVAQSHSRGCAETIRIFNFGHPIRDPGVSKTKHIVSQWRTDNSANLLAYHVLVLQHWDSTLKMLIFPSQSISSKGIHESFIEKIGTRVAFSEQMDALHWARFRVVANNIIVIIFLRSGVPLAMHSNSTARVFLWKSRRSTAGGGCCFRSWGGPPFGRLILGFQSSG